MFGAIKHGLTNLFNFSGRDARQTFWYYVLFVVVLRFIASMIVTIPIMIASMTTAFEAAKSGASEQELQGRMMAQMGSVLDSTVWLTITIGIVSVLLLCASLVRRLQDSDLSGWWVLVPGALYLAGLSQIPRQVELAKKMMSELAAHPDANPYAMMSSQGLSLIHI